MSTFFKDLLVNMRQKYVAIKDDTPSRYTHMTPAQKWAEVVKLRDMAWVLKTAAIQKCNPDWSSEQVKKVVKEIFLYATT
jgi:hypothetical protein